MFPLYDENPTRQRPIITWLLLVANVVIFIWEIVQTDNFQSARGMVKMLFSYGAIPIVVVNSVVSFDLEGLSTLFTSMFLHGGYLHIFGNMVFLFIFGDNVEDRFGRIRYLIVYLLFGVVAGLTHSYISYLAEGIDFCTSDLIGVASTCTPAVGASGAISGVLGAYLAIFPRARVVTIIFFGYFARLIRIPALYYLGFWFLLQFLYGSLGVGGSVAYWAHIGGFVVGLATGAVYRSVTRARSPFMR